MIRVVAPAKLNLSLEVLSKSEDGYHEIRSLMQAIELFDILTLEQSETDDVDLYCSDKALSNTDNLVFRAAALLKEEYGVSKGARLKLVKHIPEAGGMGGGSSDAAAAIKGLNELWDLKLSQHEMAGLGARLGSDVPFFVYGGTAVVAGRGETITPVPRGPTAWVVLLFPPIQKLDGKTAKLYAQLKGHSFTSGEHTESLVDFLQRGEAIPQACLFNAFESSALQAFDGLKRYWDVAQKTAGQQLHLAGSGPTLFAWCADEARAATTHTRLEKGKLNGIIARTL
ncbi:MAG: 4-(cytidine 5'-diphospho)-2-C-methyl-D-erythritol kinase [Dehalococcoidia bacterium]|nr:4-(cytidine 5'-diphospho)-2-C-methyl-D-erythritol kinase [Dehalococcoidia bacterium]